MPLDNRGIALGIVLISSVVFAIAAYGVLALSMAGVQHGDFIRDRRTRSRYAAESGLVKAQQVLWADPLECFPGNPDFFFDTDDNGTLETAVDIIVADIVTGICPSAGPKNLTAKVFY